MLIAGATAVGRPTEELEALGRFGAERTCDKRYDNPFVILYFFSRALHKLPPEAAEPIATRIAGAEPNGALEYARAACGLLYWKRIPNLSCISALLDSQMDTGGWERRGFYHGGRTRCRDGSLAEQHPDTPHWGSEALTTVFCLEALARWTSMSQQ